MHSPNRFVDDGKYLAAYAAEVLVRCVRCSAPGAVVAQHDGRQWVATFDCSNCDLHLSSMRGDWVGPVCLQGRRPCGYCGHKWLLPRIKQTGWPREVVESIATTCSECGRDSIVPLEPYRVYDGTGNIDPHFGLPLLLSNAGRFGAIWAYNAGHLSALKAYISATLRERSANAGNKSMFSRLPGWMKAAKNRQAVAKRLAKLEQLLPNPSIEGTSASGLRPLAAAPHVKR